MQAPPGGHHINGDGDACRGGGGHDRRSRSTSCAARCRPAQHPHHHPGPRQRCRPCDRPWSYPQQRPRHRPGRHQQSHPSRSRPLAVKAPPAPPPIAPPITEPVWPPIAPPTAAPPAPPSAPPSALRKSSAAAGKAVSPASAATINVGAIFFHMLGSPCLHMLKCRMRHTPVGGPLLSQSIRGAEYRAGGVAGYTFPSHE